MPLDPGDPYYRAELISPTIAAMEHPLCDAYGVPLGNFGSKGNENHTSGYHRSRNWILNSPDSAHGSGDYSIQLGLDHGDNDDVAAFDFTPGEWGSADNRAKMKQLTQRLLTACQNHDPRVASLREFAGTLNGTSVVTWDCSRNAFKTPFDSSHLDHIHGSIYRTKTRADHSGILSVMLGSSGTDDDMKLICQFSDGPSVFLTDFTTSRGIGSPAELAQLWAFAHSGDLVLSPRNKTAAGADQVAVFGPEWKAAILGVLLSEVPATSGPTADDIATAVVALLPQGVIDTSTVVAALQSPEGQAALVQAANTAEDS